MPIPLYLAMTAAEIGSISPLPPQIAWMSCLFSPYGRDLSNLPKSLPPDSIVILSDRTPIEGHSTSLITDQLAAVSHRFSPAGILLDFQRPDQPQAKELARVLAGALPCPVGVSEYYASDLDCPVFLPPPTINLPLQQFLLPWQGREIWLEAALEAVSFGITADGCKSEPALPATGLAHRDGKLHCHYRTEQMPNLIRFTLQRTRQDLTELLAEAEGLGVTKALGLWQELT